MKESRRRAKLIETQGPPDSETLDVTSVRWRPARQLCSHTRSPSRRAAGTVLKASIRRCHRARVRGDRCCRTQVRLSADGAQGGVCRQRQAPRVGLDGRSGKVGVAVDVGQRPVHGDACGEQANRATSNLLSIMRRATSATLTHQASNARPTMICLFFNC